MQLRLRTKLTHEEIAALREVPAVEQAVSVRSLSPSVQNVHANSMDFTFYESMPALNLECITRL